MDEAASLTYVLGERLGEGDDVVLHFFFDRVDALDRIGGFLPDLGGGFFGDDASIRHDFGSGDFDFHPGVELGLFAPDAAHLWVDVTIGQHI